MSNLKASLETLKAEVAASAAEFVASIDDIIKDHAGPPSNNPLPVPWLSQLGDDADFAPGDCGPACLAMWLRYLGHDDITVDDVSEMSGRPPGYRYTLPAHLYYTAKEWGVTLYWQHHLRTDNIRAEIDAGRPVIALVHYGALPEFVRFDSRYKAGHWLLVVGYTDEQIIYLDPYWTEGGQKTISIQAFYTAWDNNHIDGNSDRQLLRMRAS